MNKLNNIIFPIVLFILVGCSKSTSLTKQEAATEQRIDSIMFQMTLEEKVGQMAQYTIDVIGQSAGMGNTVEPFQFDKARLDTVLRQFKAGSILNTTNNKAQTPETWAYIVKTIQETAIQETGIPVIYGIDAIHGATYTVGATFFPQQIGMAATFNTALMEEGSRISAYEARASNLPWSFAPVLDLGRDARWPRLWETFGEDAYLAAKMGVASVRGFQGDDFNKVDKNHVAVSLKHFMGYGVPVSGKDRTPAIITESDLREKHFEPFRQAVEAGALSIMVNSGIVNNISTHADKRLLTDWLKKDMNYDGVLVTDWNDVENLFLRDHIAGNFKEAVMLSINTGIDMVMVPYRMDFCESLIELVNEGKVDEKRIDDAVRRVLRLKFRLGLFEHPYWTVNEYPDFGSPAHEAAAKLAADESITLLKNENNILPLKQGARILVAGPNANSMRTLNGGWSYSWQGEKTELFAAEYNTILEALKNKFGKSNVKYAAGVEYKMNGQYYEENMPEISKAIVAASGVDYIVLCVGENTYCETPGNLDELSLSENQLSLAKALQKTGKPVILVLNEGRPRIIRTIEPDSKAILQTYLPGNYGADALADILAGDVNPSGRLPYTYPKYEQGLITYDHKPGQNMEGKMEGAYDYGAQTSVQYPFGFGLSYTTFEYSDFTIDKKEFTSGDTIRINVDIKNTGSISGKEAVMLYSRDLMASLSPDIRRLRAFEKISLNPGETKTVSLMIPADNLAYVNEKGKWVLEAGEFMLQTGNLTEKIVCKENKIWVTPNK
ncbi:MAG: glycoside hydrolase family 3 C-terminal domain-containing protein [Bacteroidales bacterium]|nr:glycoside hydrolase family 3 C-terminal domain-containing protein [Bacteroidales bacterium]